ncbi:MAG: PAS domain S-box protein, partial [Syntrophaceae bacterium]|nr:PAS domain S-box protein [Syntrophaceae bacterium]
MEANFRNQQVIPVADSSGVDGRDDAVNEKLKDPGTVSNNPEKDSFKLIMEYKRSVVRICLFLGMPLVCAMAINNFVKGAHLIALLNCAMLLILGLLGFGLTKRIEEKFSYSILIRLFIAAAGMTLLYEIGFQSKFSRTEWCYIYPILVFFAVGAKEGAIWVSIFYAVVAFLMLNFDPQRITLFEIHGLRTRFLISFFAVCILSFLLEHGYRRVQQRLLHHHGILKESEDRYRQAYEKLNMETEERRRVEEALLHAAEEWRATFDSINDFVCILDLEGRILRCNKALKNFLGKPFNEIINHSCWELVLGTKDPIENCPFSRMKETRHRETTTVSIKDRWYRITIDPILDETHLLIGAVNIISDITERKQAEEDLGRLSQENAVMAEISRIISSTLNIEEVYDRFAEEVRKVLSFDRVSVSIINPDLTSVTITYASGIKVGDIEKGVVLPLDDPYQENAVRRRQGVLIQLEDENQLAKDYPHLVPHFRTGIRSVMTVPLISKDQVIGLLHFQSLKPNSYTAFHLKLAEKVGNQIAGAIASAQLFAEHKRAEEALKESEDRYRDLVECSQYLISTHDLQGRLLSVNQEGARLLGYEPRDLLGKNIRDFLAPEVRNEFDTYLQTFQKEGAAKGLMLLQTATGEKRIWEYNATLRTEGVASPIVRSIAHDVTERIRAEKAVTKLSQENAIMARIGRIISSTLNIKEVYEQFGEEVRKVIPFDWIGITMLDPEKGRLHNEYVLGNDVPGRELQMDIPVTGTFTEEVMRTRSVHLLHIEDRAELAARFPGLLPHFDSGFRSFLSVPLISKDKAIGVLHIFSLKSRTYTEADKNLAQSIGNQIAGAIANAQLFNERKRAEEA